MLAPSKQTRVGSSLMRTRLHKQKPLRKARMRGVGKNLLEAHSRMGWDGILGKMEGRNWRYSH